MASGPHLRGCSARPCVFRHRGAFRGRPSSHLPVLAPSGVLPGAVVRLASRADWHSARLIGPTRVVQPLRNGAPGLFLPRLTLDRQALDAQVAADGNGGAVWNLHPTDWIQQVRGNRDAAAAPMGPNQGTRDRGGAGNLATLTARRTLRQQVVQWLDPLPAGNQHPSVGGDEVQGGYPRRAGLDRELLQKPNRLC